MQLVVVDDDEMIARSLTRALLRQGHTVEWLADGQEAARYLASQACDFVILDLGLPGIEGHEVLSRVRAQGNQVPILVLTARDDPQDRVRALNAGADDYLVKPFELKELEARIRAITRRSSARGGGEMAAGGLRLNGTDRRVELNGQLLPLTRSEYTVLELLMRRQDWVVSKAQLHECTADWSYSVSEDAVEIIVHRVRKKIAGGGAEIVTVRGFGYLLRELPTLQ